MRLAQTIIFLIIQIANILAPYLRKPRRDMYPFFSFYLYVSEPCLFFWRIYAFYLYVSEPRLFCFFSPRCANFTVCTVKKYHGYDMDMINHFTGFNMYQHKIIKNKHVLQALSTVSLTASRNKNKNGWWGKVIFYCISR